jgi:hypothetical protein
MVEDIIIGLYLSRDPLRDFNEKLRDDEPKLRRLIHDQENLQQLCVIDSSNSPNNSSRE